MSEFKNKVITNKGLELLSKTLSGEQIQFTRVEMGSGILSDDISNVDSLIDVRQSLPITSITRKGSKVTLSATLKLEDIQSDYDWTEVGVFAKGKDDVEVLYMYGYTENSSYVSRDSLNEKLISITVMVNSTANVTAIIDNSLVYLTQSEMDAHNDDTSSHPALKTWVQGLFDSFKLTWDNILGKPDTFPPSDHAHTWNAIESKPGTYPPSEHTHSQYLTDSQKGVFRQIANVGLNDSNFSTTDIATNMYTIVNAMPKYSILMDYIKTGTHYPNLCASIIAKAKADLGVALSSDSNIIIETGNGTNTPNKITIRDNQTFKEYAFIYDRAGTTNHVGKMYQTFGEGMNKEMIYVKPSTTLQYTTGIHSISGKYIYGGTNTYKKIGQLVLPCGGTFKVVITTTRTGTIDASNNSYYSRMVVIDNSSGLVGNSSGIRMSIGAVKNDYANLSVGTVINDIFTLNSNSSATTLDQYEISNEISKLRVNETQTDTVYLTVERGGLYTLMATVGVSSAMNSGSGTANIKADFYWGVIN